MDARGAPAHPHVVVIGGGLVGLTAAYRLLQSEMREGTVDITVLEAGQRLGGKLHTIEVDGLPVEAGADSFVVRKPWAVDLCRELGLEEDLVVPGTSGAYVWNRGQLTKFIEPSAFGVPASPGSLLRWKGMSASGRVRAALDLYKTGRRKESDEALGKLLRRRLGPEAAHTLVEPLLAGLHAAGGHKLSTLATFPELSMWERRHGSLIRGARAAVKAARDSTGPMFATVWGGLSRLTSALADRIGRERIRVDAPVKAIERSQSAFMVDAGAERLIADAVVLATPAFESARLLSGVDTAASERLSSIRYASTGVVILAYPSGTAGALPDGTGFVVPTDAKAAITACTWISRKWPVPTYGDRALMRCFVGRDGREEALELSDERLIDQVGREVDAATPLGAKPVAARVVRWTRAMPQYDVGHLDLVTGIDSAIERTPGVFLAGSAYRGVGIADCIRQAEEVTVRVRRYMDPSVVVGERTELDRQANRR